ncbi:MAG: crossover junction endodeoxyribonuclease RuvC [Ruminococcaceae bacterium]|nr:crossover junction endodeoxyribonuclease RuvC [Oscillospiraceae bacterium]
MIIMGIDPGIATIGYGVITYEAGRFGVIDYGAVTTKAGMKLSDRLRNIYEDISILIERFRPDAFAIEELFFNTNVTTGISVAHGRGVIVLAAAVQNLPIYEYTPLQVKQSVAGYGRADKSQVQRMVKSLLGLSAVPKPDDTADALAIAICHAYSSGYQALTKTEGI